MASRAVTVCRFCCCLELVASAQEQDSNNSFLFLASSSLEAKEGGTATSGLRLGPGSRIAPSLSGSSRESNAGAGGANDPQRVEEDTEKKNAGSEGSDEGIDMSSKVESCDIDMDVDDTVPASSSSSSSSSSANLLPAKRQSSVKESSQVNVTRNELGEVVDVNDYHIVKELGTGAFATVYLCSTSSSAAADAAAAAESGERLSASYELYAVKVIEKSILKRKRTMTRANGRMTFKTAFDKVEEEVAVMKKLNHDNLVLLHEVIDDEEDDSMFMVLEYVQGGCVLDWDEESRTFYGKLGDGPGGLFR